MLNQILFLNSITAPLAALMNPVTAVQKAESQSYIYRTGEAREVQDTGTYNMLTLNMDMLKGRLPKLYGGITSPVEIRAKWLGDYLAKHNPDIFLGQEIPLESAEYVYQNLRDKYPHMWMGAGRTPGEQESGLFVASKYPIVSEPRFVAFGDEMQRTYTYPDELNALYPVRIIDRGFLAVETKDMWFVTSHLEPGHPDVAGSYRREQLAFIAQEMDKISNGKPYLLAGDLNIRRTAVAGEPGEDYSSSGIRDLFFDPYTTLHPNFDNTTYTCTNLLEARANNQPEPTDPKDRNEIDDYVLVRKQYEGRVDINVTLLTDTYGDNPDEALTDHRAYQTIVTVH